MKKKNKQTVELKALAKRNPRFYVHAHRNPCEPSYSDASTFVLSGSLGGIASHNGPIVQMEFPGIIGNGHNDETERYQGHDGVQRVRYSGVFRPAKGFWSLWSDTFRDLILTLPDDAEISFRVSLDGGTCDLLIPHLLHVDRLYLLAKWTRGSRTVERRYLLDSQTGHHNSARFGFGT